MRVLNLHERDEYKNADTLKRHKKSKYLKQVVQDDHANKDFSPLLILHPLREGTFCADIALSNFPSDGDIVICVCDYKLEIFTIKRNTSKRTYNKINNGSAMKCGEINLPIFVDTRTLEMMVDDNKMTLNAQVKGCLPIHRIPTNSTIMKMKIPRSKTM
jgi:hypothetical protein